MPRTDASPPPSPRKSTNSGPIKPNHEKVARVRPEDSDHDDTLSGQRLARWSQGREGVAHTLTLLDVNIPDELWDKLSTLVGSSAKWLR